MLVSFKHGIGVQDPLSTRAFEVPLIFLDIRALVGQGVWLGCNYRFIIRFYDSQSLFDSLVGVVVGKNFPFLVEERF